MWSLPLCATTCPAQIHAETNGKKTECRSWQPDSYGTGGILADDYRTIQWFKINALSGGTSYMPTGLGLRPWYLKGFNPVQPIASVAPAPIAAAPEGALPPAAEAPAGHSPFLGTLSTLLTCFRHSTRPASCHGGSVQETLDGISQAACLQHATSAHSGIASMLSAACSSIAQ